MCTFTSPYPTGPTALLARKRPAEPTHRPLAPLPETAAAGILEGPGVGHGSFPGCACAA